MPAGWAAAAVAVAGVASAAMQSDAASSASKAQQNAANQSIAAQNAQSSLTRQDQAPFLKTGIEANTRLGQLLGLGDPQAANRDKAAMAAGLKKPTLDDAATEHLGSHMQTFGTGYTAGSDMAAKERQVKQIYDRMMSEYNSKVAEIDPSTVAGAGAVDPEFGSLTRKFTADDLTADPVYQSGLKFGLDRGTEGVNARAMAGGMYDSGQTLKALTQFGNDYGSTKANESYNRFTNDQGNIYNKLAGISGTGQVALNQIASSGQNATNNISQSLEGAGNARAAGIVGGANAWGNAASGGASAYGNYQNNQTLQALLKQNQNTNYGSGNGYFGGDGSYNQNLAIANSARYGEA